MPSERSQDNLARDLREQPATFYRRRRSESRSGLPTERPLTRRVEAIHLSMWEALQKDALRAHEAFMHAARGAKLARHKGHAERAEILTKLAAKQHQRWLHASRAMTLYEH